MEIVRDEEKQLRKKNFKICKKALSWFFAGFRVDWEFLKNLLLHLQSNERFLRKWQPNLFMITVKYGKFFVQQKIFCNFTFYRYL